MMNKGNLIPPPAYGLFTVVSIVVANMVGAGIFTTSGLLAGRLPGPGWVLLCWLAGGLIAMSGALSYAELATRIPESGGEYIYLKKLFHPSLGFLTGWTSFIVGFSVAIALSALGFSEYIFSSLQYIFPVSDPAMLVYLKKATGVGVILLFTALHYMGQRAGAAVQNMLTILKISIVLLLSIAGLFLGGGISPFTLSGGGSGTLATGSAMIMVMYSYSGWNAAAYITGEVKNAARTVPLSLVLGTGIVILLYLLINIFIFSSVPYHELAGQVPVVKIAAVKVFGGWFSKIMGLLISALLLSSLSAYIIIGPRIYHRMAEDGLFFKFAGRTHVKYKVPSMSILLQGVIASLMVIIGTFEQLLLYIGFALGIFPWLAVLGLFKARRKGIGSQTVVPCPGYPFLPVLYLLSSLTLMVVAFMNKPLESSVAIATVIAGIPFYYLYRKIQEKQTENC